jgi:hypothetical protein
MMEIGKGTNPCSECRRFEECEKRWSPFLPEGLKLNMPCWKPSGCLMIREEIENGNEKEQAMHQM